MKVLLVLAALLSILSIALPSRADAKSGGSLSVRASAGTRMLELSPRDTGHFGELTIANVGNDALTVSRIAILGDDDDVRAPAKVSVRLTEGATPITIAPGASRKAIVSWLPEKDPRMKQVFAHVVVTSNDEVSGEVALGVKARLASPLFAFESRVLSLLVFLPLVGVAIALGLRIAGKKGDRAMKQVAIAITAIEGLLAIHVFSTFDPDVTRLDGNDGLQLIEHGVWLRGIGAEYFVGISGLNVAMVLLVAILAFVGALASTRLESTSTGYFAIYLCLVTGLMGAFVAQDLLLLFLFWQIALCAAALLVGVFGGARGPLAGTKMALFAAASAALMALAIAMLHQGSDRTFLVDGTTVDATFSIPELMRVGFAAKHLTALGLPLVKVAWALFFVAFGVVFAMFPFHTWLPTAAADAAAPAPVLLLLVGAVLKMGIYGLLRTSFTILPEATRWASGAIVAFGVVGMIYGALAAMAENDLRRLVAYSAMSQMGLCLIGAGSLTPEGLAGCLVQMFSHGLVAAMMILLVGTIEDRVHTRDVRRLGGLAHAMPVFAALFGAAQLAALGLPGSSGFWGPLLSLFGAFPVHGALAVAAAVGLVLVAAAHASALRRVLLGKLDESWRKSPYLEPFGGKFPEITPRELAHVAPLCVLVIVLGFWPVPLLSLVSGGVREVAALVNPPGPDQISLIP